MTITLVIKKNNKTEEWMVQYFRNGKYSETKTYYTSDKVDAVMTAIKMREEAETQGHKVITKGPHFFD